MISFLLHSLFSDIKQYHSDKFHLRVLFLLIMYLFMTELIL